MIKNVLKIGVLFLVACGGGETALPPENYLAEAEAYAKRVDEKVGSQLAYRSLPEYKFGENLWSAKVGYAEGKAVSLQLLGVAGNADKMWFYPDSASGKLLYFKEETRVEDKKVRNRIAYRGDSVAYALASNDPYVSGGSSDFRVSAAEAESAMKTIIAAVEEDIKGLSAEANEARKQNAQVFATGGKNSWTLIINPSISSAILSQPGAEERKFGYDVPKTGPSNESIYTFNSLEGKLEVSLFTTPCNSNDDRKYPYTISIKDGDKTLKGCGTLLQ